MKTKKVIKILANHFGVNEEDVEAVEDYDDEYIISFYPDYHVNIEVVNKKGTKPEINVLEVDYYKLIDSKLYFRIM